MTKTIEATQRSVSWGNRSVSWGNHAAVLALVVALLLPLLLVAPTAVSPVKAQPELLALAAEQSGQMLNVIVQPAAPGAALAPLITSMGGAVTKNLHIINAYAARVPAGAIERLATADAVRWLALDGPVFPTAISGGPATVRDEFSQRGYDNNDGSVAWLGDWVESGDYGRPTGGYTSIYSDSYCASGSCLRFKIRRNMSIQRGIDLSRAGATTLSFDYNYWTYYGADAILEISTDGENWTTLNDSWDRGGIHHESFDLTPYRSANTQIRFSVSTGYSWYGGYFRFDNIEVAYEQLPAQTYAETLNAAAAWNMGYDGTGIGVAVIDSGINAEPDFGGRVKQQLSFLEDTTLVEDTYGHGSHIAGIIGGSGAASFGAYQGIAPGVDLYSLRINDDTGMATESDLVEALQWVYDNHALYNIRVVNLSVNATLAQSYHESAIDAAAEILWFNGIVVVTSAGNISSGPSTTITAAPANDPFLITVGASHENYTADRADDVMATFSAYGTTADGFVKPDIVAPGKDIYSVLSTASEWAALYPERVVTGGEYFRLSGTSMSAPMVTGAVALMFQADPSLTPDQVKYRLTHSGSAIPGPDPAVTYPYLDVGAAVSATSTESTNTGVVASQLLWTGDEPVAWDSVSWNSVSWNSVSWNSVSWNSVSWNSVSWNSVSWND